MFTLIKIMLIFFIVYIPLPLMACGSKTQTVKKTQSLRKENPDPGNSYLTHQDRLKWKTVLQWCDECDDRAGFVIKSSEGDRGGISIIPLGKDESGRDQYLVDVECYMAMPNSEHIYYKITEDQDSIERRLLVLEACWGRVLIYLNDCE